MAERRVVKLYGLRTVDCWARIRLAVGTPVPLTPLSPGFAAETCVKRPESAAGGQAAQAGSFTQAGAKAAA